MACFSSTAFKPGDRVQQLSRSCVVLTVVSLDGMWVRCEAAHTMPATAYSPAREITLPARVHLYDLTHYAPAAMPVVEPVTVMPILPVEPMSAVALLEASIDGRITREQYDAAYAADRARRAA